MLMAHEKATGDDRRRTRSIARAQQPALTAGVKLESDATLAATCVSQRREGGTLVEGKQKMRPL